jgi:hypothetical protein
VQNLKKWLLGHASTHVLLFGQRFPAVNAGGQPIERLAHVDVPHPFSPALEDAVRPNKDKIIKTARDMVTGNCRKSGALAEAEARPNT